MRVKRTHMCDRLRRVCYDEVCGFIAVHWSFRTCVTQNVNYRRSALVVRYMCHEIGIISLRFQRDKEYESLVKTYCAVLGCYS